ncbi:biliverdin-producing heme oxygenase [Altericroceibacterium xinjiangense]|uniref:biliverdin-producing heme oxygenase n=1 Tax=Altericroceibacterium xinjiangense TaxID=762261 RepID=UPI0013E0287D|nr:biliverdin-producing heme oxygenase [Altericroceibacterium xinjiangense]
MRTEAAHQRLHELEAARRILDGTVTLSQYRGLLLGFLRFHHLARPILETGHRELAAAGFRFALRDPLPRIEADLAATGNLVSRSGLPPLQARSPAEAVGWVWAIEGSALGGQVLHRALDSLFGDAPDGRTYFQADGERGRWKRFCDALEDYGSRDANSEAVVSGATAAFDCIEQCLTTGSGNA